jgi:adenylate kinase
MIRNMMEAHLDAKGFIFDGFPRTEAQAEALDEMLNAKNEPIVAMLALGSAREELVKRLAGRGATSGRSDDARRGRDPQPHPLSTRRRPHP